MSRSPGCRLCSLMNRQSTNATKFTPFGCGEKGFHKNSCDGWHVDFCPNHFWVLRFCHLRQGLRPFLFANGPVDGCRGSRNKRR